MGVYWQNTDMAESYKKLYRSRDNRVIAGVAAGLAKYTNMDPTVMRLIFVVLGFVSFGTMLILYLLAAILIPEEPVGGQKV